MDSDASKDGLSGQPRLHLCSQKGRVKGGSCVLYRQKSSHIKKKKKSHLELQRKEISPIPGNRCTVSRKDADFPALCHLQIPVHPTSAQVHTVHEVMKQPSRKPWNLGRAVLQGWQIIRQEKTKTKQMSTISRVRCVI